MIDVGDQEVLIGEGCGFEDVSGSFEIEEQTTATLLMPFGLLIDIQFENITTEETFWMIDNSSVELTPGEYNVNGFVDIGGCGPVLIDVGDQEVLIGEGCGLQIVSRRFYIADNGCSVSWTGPEDFTSTEASLSGLEEGDYTVTVTSDDGCSSSETVTVSDDAVIDECGVCGGDNSSCSGCMNSAASNYNETATIEDGSCLYDQSYVDSAECPDVIGCMDSTACNYDETAATDDESCEFTSCLDLCGVLNGDNSTCSGCTYEDAVNYEDEALVDDGSCVFENASPVIDATLVQPIDILVNTTASLVTSQLLWDFGVIYDGDTDLNDLVITLSIDNSNIGLDWDGALDSSPLVVPDADFVGTGVITICVSDGTSTVCANNFINVNSAGCTNASACNYDATATIDDNSCDFEACLDQCGVPNGDNTSCLDQCGVINGDNSTCRGCTYEYAEEYDPNAIIDDGSCSENIACPGDFSGDGFVNVSDLGGFLGAFGESCE